MLPCLTPLSERWRRWALNSHPQEDLSLVGVVDASVFDADGEDGSNDASQDINTTVLTAHDIYLNTAAYQLSPMRFRNRGYSNIYEETYINGMPFNDQLRGVFNYASIGAMNILTRHGDQTNNAMHLRNYRRRE